MKPTLPPNVCAAICIAALFLCLSTNAAITVIDYYRLGDADPGAVNGAVVNTTAQDSAGTKHLTRIGSPTYTSDVFSGATLRAGSQLAVSFSGGGQGLSNAVVSTATDNFGIEAWVRTKSPVGNHSIVYNGNTSTSGWGIYQFGGTYGALFGGVIIFGSIPATVNDWAHLALVRASGVTTLYLNGTPAATSASNPNVPAGGFCIGLPGQGGGTENFNGDVDEVRVFTFTAGQFSTNDLLVNAPAGVSIATMNDALQTDTNGNGRFNPGDTVRYTVVITNNTGGTLSNVVFNSSAVPNAPEVAASLRATPLARADRPATNSAPGSAFHGALNIALNIPAGSGLLANDFVGVPAATIVSFGGGAFGGSVIANAAGATANNPAVGSLTVTADGSLTFTPATGFNGTTTFQYRLANSAGTNDTSVTLAIGVRPSAVNDAIVVTGNTLLDSSLIPLSLLGNDAGDLIGVSSIANPSFGAFGFNANGNFIFTPNVGASGAANVTYTITNGFGSAQAQIVMTLGNPVWYIDGASVAGAADGRSHTPFKTIAAFNAVNNGAAGNPADNQPILLRDGTYTDGITLRLGQRLIGDGSSGDLSTALGVTLMAGSAVAPGVAVPAFSGADPVITSAAGNGVILNANNTIRGLTVGNTPAGVGFLGGAVGSLTISESSKTGTGGAISITNSGGLGVSFETLDSANAPGAAINLVSCGGTFSATTGTISAPVGPAILINGAGGPINYPGPITKNNAGRIVDIQNRTGGSITLNGSLAQNNAAGTGINLSSNASTTITFGGASKVLNTAANPALTLTNNTGTTVTFSNGGLDLDTTTAPGVILVSANNLTINGAGNSITTGTGTSFFNNGGNGTIDINAPLTGTGRLIDIQNRTGGSVTLSGNLNNSGGTGMLIQNNSGGGTIALSGATKTFNTGANTAVNLVNNSGTTINFTGGGLTITNTVTGFNATGGAAGISVTGAGNIINSGTATALNVVNSTIGGSGLTFQRISSSGGTATGIILDNTGSSGGLTVTGDGVNTSKGGNGTGGTIANKTGADGSTTTGCGIYLNNTANVSLRRMQINDVQNMGVHGLSVNGFTMQYCSINGVNGTTSANTDGALSMGRSNPSGANGLLGTSLIDNCRFSGAVEHNLEFYNQSGTFNLTISNCDVKSNSVAFGSDGILTEMQGTASATISIQNCFFDDNKSQAVQAAANDSSFIDITINGCTVTRTTQGNEGFVLSNGSNGDMVARVTTNSITGFGGVSIFVGQTAGNATASSFLTATIKSNTITTTPTASNHGIIAFLTSTVGQVSSANILIEQNVVNQISTTGVARPILVDTPDANTTPSFTATVINNIVSVDAATGTSMDVTARRGAGCFDVRGNQVSGPFGVRVRQAAPATVQLEQGVSGSAVAATVLDDNHAAGTVTSVLGTVTVVPNNTCQAPPP